MPTDATPIPGRRTAAVALFGVSVAHLPVIYLLVARADGAPSYALVPLTAVAMGAAWGSGILIERGPLRTPLAATALALLELPLAIALPAAAALRAPDLLAGLAISFLLALVALGALLSGPRAASGAAARPQP